MFQPVRQARSASPPLTDDILSFELGIDQDALLNQHVISRVKPGSAADRAGIAGRPARDGYQCLLERCVETRET